MRDIELIYLTGRILALDKDQLKIIRPTSEVSAGSETPPASRHIPDERGDWPVVSLNEDLLPLGDIPSRHQYCACCGDRNGDRIALTCEKVARLEEGYSLFAPLPEGMRVQSSPISDLIIDNNRLIVKVDVAGIIRWLRTLENVHDRG